MYNDGNLWSKWKKGDKIANRYEIYNIVCGEIGIVYICYDHEDKIPIVLKTIQDKYLFSEEMQELLEKEALVWINLGKYPYIVRALSVEKLEGRLFILLEYIPPALQRRNTLTYYLGNLNFIQILKFSIQFCYGMEYAYSKGIDAHRNIKPDNLMITHNKILKITDFGLAKALQEIQFKEDIVSIGERAGISIFQSKGKKVCGTLPYMAPEQFDGYADRRSDIYSFGILLYQMLANGKLPFIGSSPQEYEKLHKYEKVPFITSPLFQVVQRCLEKSPDERYQDFISIREELQNLLLKETGEKIIPPDREELEGLELNIKGVALGDLGRYEEEILCYDKALQIDPKFVEAWYNKGVVLGYLDRYEEAILCFDKALQIDPKYVDAWYAKGIALGYLGRYEEEIFCYDKALQTDPKYLKAWYNKGIVLGYLDRYEEAILCYDKALQIDPKFLEAWYNKGVALGYLGRHEEALLCFDKALQIDPKFVDAWYNKAVALENLGRYEEAKNCYEKAYQIKYFN